MPGTVSDATLSGLSAFLAARLGLMFPRERWHDLERGVASAARRFGFDDAERCARWLQSAPLTHGEIEILAGFFTVGETYFFRDPAVFETVETEILPGLLRSRRERGRSLRIWSAGCSTGEEPYSIAVLLHRLLPDLERWNITILATDINQAALQQGADGVYGNWSFRAAPSWLKARYFTPEQEGRLRVDERLRRLVRFEYLNLAEDGYPSLANNSNAMDIIFCRNVLIYFTPEVMGRVVEKLHASLVEDGWLVAGVVDFHNRSPESFEAVRFPGATCYRKRGQVPTDKRPEPIAGAPAPVPGAPPAQGEPGPATAAAEPTEPPYETALACYRRGLYAQAAAILTKLPRHGITVQELTLLVRSLANEGKLAEAQRVCEEAIEGSKLDPALHCLRAEILQERGEVEQARNALKRALYLDPKLVLAHFALGNLTLWEGEEGKALKHFDNALNLLQAFAADEILPGAEGLTAGRLREIVASMMRLPRGAGRGRQ